MNRPPESAFQTPSQERREKESTREKIERCLQSHVVDIKPKWFGDEKHRAMVGSNPVAAVESSIHRCDPPLHVPKLTIEKGKVSVLVGPNGAGKSTLLDAIMRRRHADFDSGSHGYSEGVHGKETLRISRLDQEELLQEVKDVSTKEVLEHVKEFFISQFPVDWEDWENTDPDTNEKNEAAKTRIETLLSQAVKLFDVNLFLDRKVSELSGGERTKLSLLMVLASEPDVLLLDEPTNHLDLESIAKLTGLFDSYKRAGVGIVNVSHVEWFLDMVGENTLEIGLKNGERTVTQSTSPHKTYKKREAPKELIREPIIWEKTPTKPTTGSIFEGGDSITVPNSPIKKAVLPSISAGDITVLSGQNGTGKTRLMEQFANPHSKIVHRSERVQTAYMPQLWPEEIMKGDITNFFHWVKEHCNPHSDVAPSRLQKELQRLEFGTGRKNILQQRFEEFSGGEQRLLWFAAASIIEGTDTLILDEPSNHMDEATMMKVVEAIRNFPGAVILSTHDLRLMEALEKNPGRTREGVGVRNIKLERTKDGRIEINPQTTSPLEDAKRTIEQSSKQAKRVKV